MAHDYSISEFGLKLIKAYEGFRPVEAVLVSGQRVIGYGHQYVPGEVSVLTKKKASEILKADLAPFEELVNHNIFAPLSQGQFDALVSFSFNIGGPAFLNSSVVHYLNNGQPLAAAAGFDEWCKSIIDNKTYVVDALVRRRTAEKALFLSPATGVVAAPRNEIPPLKDNKARSGADSIQVFNQSDASGYVDQTPYDAQPAQFRRREDGPAGILTLSERAADPIISETPVYEDGTNTDLASDEPDRQARKNLSPIAVAAAEVSERLDNLMADTPAEHGEPESQPPETRQKTVSEDWSGSGDSIQENTKSEDESANTITDDNISEAKIDTYIPKTDDNTEISGIGAYWTALMVGLALLGGGLWKLKFARPQVIDEMSAFLAPIAILVGAMMVLGGLYYLLKAQMRKMAA